MIVYSELMLDEETYSYTGDQYYLEYKLEEAKRDIIGHLLNKVKDSVDIYTNENDPYSRPRMFARINIISESDIKEIKDNLSYLQGCGVDKIVNNIKRLLDGPIEEQYHLT